MKRLRFILIGGFLGAGKTTTIARLARHYLDRGQRVGLVTNDQAQDLVDTNSLRAQGFPVEEVAGACFCCRFDDLVGKVTQLQQGERPDVILAEPVGSCTDLVATVVQPLRDLYGARFEVTTSDGMVLQIQGQFHEWDFTIIDHYGRLLGHITKEFAFLGDHYTVDVAPGVDGPFIIALAVILDEIREDGGKD